jgi:5'-nucleotidase / UDP-sugar diphosphatase
VKSILLIMLLSATLVVGCTNNKKKRQDTSPMPAAAQVLNVPAAPAAQYTPPPAPQSVVFETPQQRPQPVIHDAAVQATPEAAAEAEPVVESTPAPAANRQVAQKSTPRSSKKYTVKKGESLWSIAEERYGDGNKWKRIAAANPKLNPDRVQAGQTIVLP